MVSSASDFVKCFSYHIGSLDSITGFIVTLSNLQHTGEVPTICIRVTYSEHVELHVVAAVFKHLCCRRDSSEDDPCYQHWSSFYFSS